jgi:hypothetical protein
VAMLRSMLGLVPGIARGGRKQPLDWWNPLPPHQLTCQVQNATPSSVQLSGSIGVHHQNGEIVLCVSRSSTSHVGKHVGRNVFVSGGYMRVAKCSNCGAVPERIVDGLCFVACQNCGFESLQWGDMSRAIRNWNAISKTNFP